MWVRRVFAFVGDPSARTVIEGCEGLRPGDIDPLPVAMKARFADREKPASPGQLPPVARHKV